MLYKSSNLNPNLTEIDVTENNILSAQVNTTGTTVKACRVKIITGDGNDVLYDSDNGYSSTNLPPNLKKPVVNKGIVNFDLTSEICTANNVVNGKDYQWNIRTYEAKRGSTAQPQTTVCQGFLVGSTKSVIWTSYVENSDINNALIYDKYIEIKGYDSSGNSNFMPLPDPNTEQLVIPTDKTFKERKKIYWVENELGWNKNYTKLEFDDLFTYSYKDGTTFDVYQCDDQHTLTSFYVNPNDDLERARWVEIYKSDGTSINGATAVKYKIIGYGEETGEIRLQEALPEVPQNGWTYKLFKKDTVKDTYEEVVVPSPNNILGGSPLASGKLISNRNASEGVTAQYFIQPNINIGSDKFNPAEIVFDKTGARIDLYEKTSDTVVPRRTTDITFDKLDNTQWLIEVKDGIIEQGTIPIAPKTPYTAYTDFMDSMPNAIFYARTKPNLTIFYNNLNNQANDVLYITPDAQIETLIKQHKNVYIELFNSEGQSVAEKNKIISYDNAIGYVKCANSFDLFYEDEVEFFTYKLYTYNADTQVYTELTGVENAQASNYASTTSGTQPWRDVHFKTDWDSPENVQVKYYKYTLYDSLCNVVAQSEDIYDSLLEWSFRGLQTSDDVELPNKYTIQIDITDQYGDEFIQTANFTIWYQIDQNVTPLATTFDCKEGAITLYANAPVYTAPVEKNGLKAVDESNIYIFGDDLPSKAILKIGDGECLCYDRLVSNGNPLVFPPSFVFLTRLQLTPRFNELTPTPRNQIVFQIAHTAQYGQEAIGDTPATEEIIDTYTLKCGSTESFYMDNTGKIVPNPDQYLIKVYKNDETEPLMCFKNGTANSFNIQTEDKRFDGTTGYFFSPTAIKNALQSQTNIQIVSALPPSITPEIAAKKYLLTATTGKYLSGGIYKYNTITEEWELQAEDYYFLENISQVDGATYESLDVPTVAQGENGEILWYDETENPNSDLLYIDSHLINELNTKAFNDRWFLIVLKVIRENNNSTVTCDIRIETRKEVVSHGE